MLTKIPVAGVAWLVGQYATGFERLGYEVYYVEAHARTPSMFMTHEARRRHRRGRQRTSAGIAERFGLGDRWAFQALHEHGRCYGMSAEQLDRLYRDAALIVNMHGGTLPLPEHAATDRLVFLGHRPGRGRARASSGATERALEFLDQHVAFFTWGLNFGNPDCGLPWARPVHRSSPARHPWSSTSGTTMSSPTVRPSRRSGTGVSPTATSGTRAGSTAGASTSSSSRSSTCR